MTQQLLLFSKVDNDNTDAVHHADIAFVETQTTFLNKESRLRVQLSKQFNSIFVILKTPTRHDQLDHDVNHIVESYLTSFLNHE